MLILTIKTDQPEAEAVLFNSDMVLDEVRWQGHRQLSETIHTKIHELLTKHKKDWHELGGIVCFKGPGSFTGLRIGLTVGNGLSANLDIPIVATSGRDWQHDGVSKLLHGENQEIAIPEYGRFAHITKPKR